ncbi:MAG: hypothetical protein N5P05_002496 [Chroococcopsis gigantea SAG 12.99]|jgi:hypothetical protein|nr:hypothetical protein [Chroococcopsis gigantea SAG 12.99]
MVYLGKSKDCQWCDMLKRIFLAVGITLPLYIFLLLEQSPPSHRDTSKLDKQPQESINILKRTVTNIKEKLIQPQGTNVNNRSSY